MKRFIMKVAVAGTVLASTLGAFAASAPSAEARPRFGQRYTGANGYIVWVKGDYAYSRVRCAWWAGRNWSINYLLAPGQYKWTTSDAGNWGAHPPAEPRLHVPPRLIRVAGAGLKPPRRTEARPGSPESIDAAPPGLQIGGRDGR